MWSFVETFCRYFASRYNVNMNDTISEIQQNNMIWRHRLGKLMDEDVGDVTDDKLVKQWANFKDTVNEIKNKEYGFPLRSEIYSGRSERVEAKNPERLDARTNMRLDVRNSERLEVRNLERLDGKYRSFDLRPEIAVPNSKYDLDEVSDILDNEQENLASHKIRSQSEVIKQLRLMLEQKEIDRREIIEEFQFKEIELLRALEKQKETREKEKSQEKTQWEKQLQRQNEIHHKEIQMLNPPPQHDLPPDIKLVVNKLSIKLLLYKRKVSDLELKNDSLIQINRYLTNSDHSEHKGKEEIDYFDDSTQALIQPANLTIDQASNRTIGKPSSEANYIDTTTEILIQGKSSKTISMTRLFRKAILAVIFINRTQKFVLERHMIDKRIEEMMS